MDTFDLSKKCNEIKQVAVSELLDGRFFFIPSYQRGYRWTKTQVYDLCNDLLEFALKPNKDSRTFYSLQPLIVRKVRKYIAGEERDAYEVIDGQQRLTTIYVLYKFIMHYKKYESYKELKQKEGVELYHLFYETRPNDFEVIENIGFKSILWSDIRDIDIAHIVNAYHYISQWLDNGKEEDPNCAENTFTLCSSERYKANAGIDAIFNLLNNNQNTTNREGNAQFIWYEIDAEKDAIQEFLNENKGKIKLTDTEKIRALFMQRKNSDAKYDSMQLSIAKDWELIENTLHRNDFWSFISNDTKKEDGRIDVIFEYLYRRDCKDECYSGDDYLFRYYYNLFNKKSADNSIIISEWNKVMDAFRMLQNWYRNPRIYNLVGLLTKENGVSKEDLSINAISDIYDSTNVCTTEQFVERLKQKVCSVIVDNIPISKNENKNLEIQGDHIELYFDKPQDKKKIPGLLRFLNVNLLCKRIEELLKIVDKPDEKKKRSDMGRSNRDEQCAIYRFPFEALDVFGWDVEHIDSATTNELKKPEEQEKWIEEAEKALGKTLAENKEYSELKEVYEKATGDRQAIISQMLSIIYEIIGENDDEPRKNWIGNLTLLDSGTNRQYKNKIFAIKREIIRERINEGVFVPICTQNVFNKIYDSCSSSYLRWDINDKKAYHNFILNELRQFKENYGKK